MIRALVALAIVAGSVYALRKYLAGVPAALRTLHPDWWFVALASAVVLTVYLLLVETWRIIIVSFGANLRFRDALWVWFLSNLGRYAPIPFFQVPLLSYMAKQLGVAVSVSVSASIVVTVLNVISGLAVVALLANRLILGTGYVAQFLVAVTMAALMLVALYTPRIISVIARLVRRPIEVPEISGRALAAGLIGTAVGWVGYGLAFELFTIGMLNRPPGAGALPAFIAVYTASYLAGFLSIVTPAGAGVAEVVMVAMAPQVGLSSRTTATLLALLVRAWRTILEIVPGLGALPMARRLKGPSGRPATDDRR